MWLAHESSTLEYLFDKHILGHNENEKTQAGFLATMGRLPTTVHASLGHFELVYTNVSTMFSLNTCTILSTKESYTPLSKEILKQYVHFSPAIYILGIYLADMLTHVLKTCAITGSVIIAKDRK